MIEDNLVWRCLALFIYCLRSIFVCKYILLPVGRKIKSVLENAVTSLSIIPKGCNNRVANSIMMSLLFLVSGLILCIPLRHLYLSGLTYQEDRIVREITSDLIHKDNAVYFFINVDWLPVLYFSFLCTSFLLSFSYCIATAFDTMQQELQMRKDVQKKFVAKEDIYIDV